MEQQTKLKLLFTVMILAFVSLTLGGQYYYDLYKHSIDETISQAYINTTNIVFGDFQGTTILNPKLIQYIPDNATCKLNPDLNKTIILRLDDVKSFQYYDITKDITNEVLDRNMSITFGVIPEGTDKDKQFISFINSVKYNPNVEIALHGLNHNGAEFENLTEDEAYAKLIEGKQILKAYLGVVPATFIPPENSYSSGTEGALADAQFKIISAGENEYKPNDDIIYLGYNSKTYDFDDHVYVPTGEAIAACQNKFLTQDTCVIMLHPQDYLLKDANGATTHQIDQVKYAEFIALLDRIQTLRVQTKTFKDVVTCN